MKRSFMRSRNDAKLCLAAGPYLRRPLNPLPPGGDGSKPRGIERKCSNGELYRVVLRLFGAEGYGGADGGGAAGWVDCG